MSMTRDENYASIQAFPIHSGTYIDIPTDVSTSGYKLLHAEEDATVTFAFSGGDIVATMLAGEDVGIAPDCITVTATAKIRMS